MFHTTQPLFTLCTRQTSGVKGISIANPDIRRGHPRRIRELAGSDPALHTSPVARALRYNRQT